MSRYNKVNRRRTRGQRADAPAGGGPAEREWWLTAAGLFLVTIIAYFPAWSAGGFIWDDDDYVTENVTLRSLSGLWQIWFKPGATHQYYPLVHSTFWIEHRLWGFWAPGFHAVNVLLHACNAVLLWRLLQRLAVPGALFAAGIFALHPVHAESVAWITERKNVLSGLFYLLSLGGFLRAVPDLIQTSTAGEKKPFKFWYAVSLLCFVAALLSKTVTCTLPAVLLLIAWWKHGRIGLRHVMLTLPFFTLGVGLALVTVWLEKNQVGAQGREWSFTFAERLLIAGRALWFYPAKLLWPYPLAFFYAKWQLGSSSMLQWMFPLTYALFLLTLVVLSKRLGRGVATAMLFSAGTLFPALGFINVYPMRYSYVADHFNYLGSIGWIVLFAAGMQMAAQRFVLHPRAVLAGVMTVLCAMLVGLTIQRSYILSDLERLWRDTLAKNWNADIAHANLGNLLTSKGKFEEGLSHYRIAISHDPDDDFAHYNAGVNLYRQGKVDEAIPHYREALRIQPRYFEAHFNLGKALEAKGETANALEQYRQAIAIHPGFITARIAEAVLLVSLGRQNDAVEQYHQVLKLDPGNTTAHYNLGAALLDLGRNAEAAEQFREVVRLNPSDAEARRLLDLLERDSGSK